MWGCLETEPSFPVCFACWYIPILGMLSGEAQTSQNYQVMFWERPGAPMPPIKVPVMKAAVSSCTRPGAMCTSLRLCPLYYNQVVMPRLAHSWGKGQSTLAWGRDTLSAKACVFSCVLFCFTETGSCVAQASLKFMMLCQQHTESIDMHHHIWSRPQ